MAGAQGCLFSPPENSLSARPKQQFRIFSVSLGLGAWEELTLPAWLAGSPLPWLGCGVPGGTSLREGSPRPQDRGLTTAER